MDLNKAIDQARQQQGMSWTDLARRIGTATHTLSNMRHGRTIPRAEHVLALEHALGWVEGSYWTVRNGGEPTLKDTTTHGTLTDQLRMVGHTTTTHGTLTWVAQPGGLRDYTLSREILGAQRGVSLLGTTLPPNTAATDLAVGLDTLERLLTAPQETT